MSLFVECCTFGLLVLYMGFWAFSFLKNRFLGFFNFLKERFLGFFNFLRKQILGEVDR